MTEEIATLMMVTYNRLPLTRQTVEGLLETTKRPFNLVIIDNNSQDGTKEYLAKLSKDGYEYLQTVSVVFNDRNEGIAVARNQALHAADRMNTTWYSTVDNDVLLPEHWLSNCIDILRANPSYGMVGVNFENSSYPLVTSNGYEFQDKPKGNLGTACTVFHKRFHQMLGFFNTEYELYGEEDADMGMRAKAAGFKLGYLKEHGTHLGDNENDVGEYRDFKTECHRKNLKQFSQNAGLYFNHKKPIYIPFVGKK